MQRVFSRTPDALWDGCDLRDIVVRLGQYAPLLDLLPVPVIIKDQRPPDVGRILFVNEAALIIYGRPRDEVLGRSDGDLLSREEADFYHAIDLRAIRERRPVEVSDQDLSAFAPTGRIWFATKYPVFTEGGDPFAVVIVSKDLTGEMIAEREKQDTRNRLLERLQRVTSQLPGAIYEFRIGPDGAVSFPYMSEKVSEIYGNTAAEWMADARAGFDRILPEDLGPLNESIDISHRDCSPWQHECRIRATDGSIRWIFANSIPQRQADGSTLWYGFLMDATERKLLEGENERQRRFAERASKAKGEFLAMMSHEIRTPLNAVLGFADLLESTPLDNLQREYLGTLRSSGAVLLSIISDILDYSRIEAGSLDLERLPYDPEEIVREVVRIEGPAAESKGVILEFSAAAGVPKEVFGDAMRLRQVLLNIVANALKFTDEGGVVLRLSQCGEPDPVLLFEVEDTGCGMEPDQLDRIFKPFTQYDASISRRHGGTGLGLAISRQLVERMGGKIWAESTPGRGSCFRFTIKPAPDFTETPDILPGGEPRQNGGVSPGGRVLIVEDNPVNCRLARAIVERMGFEVHEASSGEAALEAIAGGAFQCVLMDIQMPGLDGYETTRRLRQLPNGRSVRVVALTAHASREDRARCLAAGMDDYLTKPMRKPDLFRAIVSRDEIDD